LNTCSLHVLGLISGLEMEVLLVPMTDPFMSSYGNLHKLIRCGVRPRHKVTLKAENHFCSEVCIYYTSEQRTLAWVEMVMK